MFRVSWYSHGPMQSADRTANFCTPTRGNPIAVLSALVIAVPIRLQALCQAPTYKNKIVRLVFNSASPSLMAQ